MIGRVEACLRRLLRAIDRSEWLVRLLRLSESRGTATVPGLLMIQIDGLSHTQLNRALERGEMPFLRRLIEREHYRLHRHYSGMPSATAAVQGELFYGVTGGVPAFSFRQGGSGRIVRMFESEPVARVERELAEKGGAPLLEGGSAYVDNFAGGAAEAHFCPTSLGWGPALRSANPLVVGLLILSNTYSFLRTAALLVLEFMLAMVDCARGIVDKQDLVKELEFVPSRVAIAILLRELATIGAKIDVARGLPIIHLNFLGYDEQAHRRGPASAFAHWTLKGIDDAIARLWWAAHRSARRRYDVWVYSDHGQEAVVPYAKRFGRTLEAAVGEAFATRAGVTGPVAPAGVRGARDQRVRWLGGTRIQRLFPVNDPVPEETGRSAPLVVARGPIGMVYTQPSLAEEKRGDVARALVTTAGVPLVLRAVGMDKARVWTREGDFVLPEQAAEVLGRTHPFLEELARDLVGLCHHPDAGDFVLCGWCDGTESYSFAIENGAHGGAGPEETGAFALLPGDAPLPEGERDYLRPRDLRHAALDLLGRVESKSAGRQRRAAEDTLRIMTYNVHSCIGMDGKLTPERIARIIARYAPDVVALQELDVGRARTEGIDQAHFIARYLEMDLHFHPALHIEEEQYGDAILTRLPMRLVKSGPLPGLRNRPWLEPRGALWVAVDMDGTEIQIINTHLGLLPRERRVQAEALLGPEWLAHPQCSGPVVLCGDFNALPSSPVCRRLHSRLGDAQIELERHRPRATFFGRFPTARIDHIFVDPGIEVLDIEVPDSELARVASDHLPLIAELRVPSPRGDRLAVA